MLPLAASCGTESAERPPSVILISLDTLRAGHMSLYGYERETTPYLQKFAAQECLTFDQAHSVSPWTLISHVTMLTGLYPEQHGVIDKQYALSPQIPFLAERLSEEGFQTLGLYKPGFIGARYGHDRGFDVFLDHEQAPGADKNLAEVLPRLDRDDPFFMFLHLFDIHSDPLRSAQSLFYDPPPPYDTMFSMDAKKRLSGVDLRPAAKGKVNANQQQVADLVSLYDGKIRYVDTILKGWIEGWRRDGLLDNTILIITADHGESLGQRGGRIVGHGRMFEDGLHVPLIVRFPDGYRAGEREPLLVSSVDIVPTILEAAGLEPDERLPGRTLRGQVEPNRIVGAMKSQMSARIQLPYKVMMFDGKPSCFNIVEDPLELNQIMDLELHKKVVKDLKQAYNKEIASRPAFDAPAIPALVQETEVMRKELEALGYAGED